MGVKNLKEDKQNKGIQYVTDQELAAIQFHYDCIVKEGFLVNPFEKLPLNNEGKPKKPTPYLLLERLDKYAPQIIDFEVPFDNNRCERDIRMVKVKQKVSGRFRARVAPQVFTHIRSYLVCCQKQGYAAFDDLQLLFKKDFSLTHQVFQI